MITYIVETTIRPGVTYEVSQAEYERLLQLGLLVNGPAEPVSPDIFDIAVSDLLSDASSRSRAAAAEILPVTVPDASGTTKGVLQLAGDFGGTASAPTLAATGTRDATTFLRGDNTWAVPPGSGSGGGSATVVDNGDGTYTVSGEAVTDNGDGTFSIAA